MKKKRYDWQPPRFGSKKDNEVECYTFAIHARYGMPFSKDAKHFADAMATIDKKKYIGLYPCIPQGIFIICETLNDAKECRNLLKFAGIKCGDNIGTCYVDKAYIQD